MSSPQRKKQKNGKDKKAPLSRTDFVRRVFEQYRIVPLFHHHWYTIEDLVSNMNNYFYIDKALSITIEDMTIRVLRQNHIQLSLSLHQGEPNQIGLYRAHFCLHGGTKVLIYQTTPGGIPPSHLVDDIPLLLRNVRYVY